MNQVININHGQKSVSPSTKGIAQSIFDFITFKSFRALFSIKFDISLNEDDMKEINAQIWT